MESNEDHHCALCFEVFYYPVTLPCKHRFCKDCFDCHLKNNSIRCPLCRVRLSIWLRRIKNNSENIVDTEFWSEIQKLYPQEIKSRKSGKLVANYLPECGYVNESPEPKRLLAKPGEIRLEYEELLRKEAEEIKKREEKNLRLSEPIIKLIEEEIKLDELREQKEREIQLKEDEKIAKEIQRSSASDISSIFEVTISNADDDNTNDSDVSNSDPYPDSFAMDKALCGDDPCFLGPVSQSPVPFQNIDSISLSSSGEKRSHHQAFCSKTTNQKKSPRGQTSKADLFDKFFAGIPQKRTTTSSLNISKSTLTASGVSSKTVAEPASTTTTSITDQNLSNFAAVLPGPSTSKDVPFVTQRVTFMSRSSSGADSIDQEFHHFKPIRSSPTTPSKDGGSSQIPHLVVAQRGLDRLTVNDTAKELLELSRESGGDLSVEELEDSLWLENQIEKDRLLALEIQEQLNKEKIPVITVYNLRKKKRSNLRRKKKELVDRTQKRLDRMLYK